MNFVRSLDMFRRREFWFSGDIASNIMFGNSHGSDDEMIEAAEIAQATEFIDTKPEKYKSPISQGGSNVSGGQKQRAAIARALITQPQLILADEPTGALDSKNARSLMEKLSGLNRDEQATILMVTHDSNAASFCKRILFIQDGVIFMSFGVETKASRSSTGTS